MLISTNRQSTTISTLVTIFLVSPYTAFIHSIIFPAFLSKITLLLFDTILVTFINIVVLGFMASVVSSSFNQRVHEILRLLHKFHCLSCHGFVYCLPFPSAFLINKAAGCLVSIV